MADIADDGVKLRESSNLPLGPMSVAMARISISAYFLFLLPFLPLSLSLGLKLVSIIVIQT